GTVADLSELWFLAKIFETDLDAIRPDEKAVVRLNPYPSELFQGRITYIGNQIDPVSRTVLARIIIRNRKNLVRVGLFGTAEVTTVDPEIIAIRPETISSIDGKDFVFIEEKPGEYRLREVKTGRKNNALVEIKSGLEEEEYLVESGIFLLKSKLLKKTFGGE
ncbi:MAG: efflux RND transporter periplasmic adaptor subunit, partial [Leptospira sp.]|nr:efflux RND transporter periplasmic adaptor subunit [Leptospira sp.]